MGYGNPAEAGLHDDTAEAGLHDDTAEADQDTMDEDQLTQRAIVGFRQDDEGHWVAELACGHSQHMRHEPPWQDRKWVLTSEGRARFVGVRIECRLCAEQD